MPDTASLEEEYDVIIIGAGLSGLSAGIRLSQFYDKVVILESHSIPGGLNSYYTKGKKRELYSSGLHTLTNANVTHRKWGLSLISRSLGIAVEEFGISQPVMNSRITVPELSVEFSNDAELLRGELSAKLGVSADSILAFEKKVIELCGDPLSSNSSSNEFLEQWYDNPIARDLLKLPVFTYAGYAEGDLDLRTFCLLYRSIFIDGCGSPVDMKQFLEVLVSKYKGNGGELHFRKQVSEILASEGKVRGVKLSDGREVRAKYVLSSCGAFETSRLVGHEVKFGSPGVISLFQLVASFEDSVAENGMKESLHFVSTASPLKWNFSKEEDLLKVVTFSAQDSYEFPSTKHQLKISCFDQYDFWDGLDRERYKEKKEARKEQLLEFTKSFYPGLNQQKILQFDSFSPLTIKRYTAHANGTLYGGSEKFFDGRTPVENLFLIGNDQGGIGIMGALTSGILVSNYNIILSQD